MDHLKGDLDETGILDRSSLQCRLYFGAEHYINGFDGAILDCNWMLD